VVVRRAARACDRRTLLQCRICVVTFHALVVPEGIRGQLHGDLPLCLVSRARYLDLDTGTTDTGVACGAALDRAERWRPGTRCRAIRHEPRRCGGGGTAAWRIQVC